MTQPPSAPLLRLATRHDLPVINAIYNHYVLHSTCTFQLVPSTDDERLAWFLDHSLPAHPVTVATRDDTVVGWASLSRFHPREAYRFTVEDSLYIHPAHHRQGLGRLLLNDLLTRATLAGHRSIIALIAADQLPSIHLHTTAGFTPAGHLRHVGHKFNQWLDVLYLQKLLPQQNP